VQRYNKETERETNRPKRMWSACFSCRRARDGEGGEQYYTVPRWVLYSSPKGRQPPQTEDHGNLA